MNDISAMKKLNKPEEPNPCPVCGRDRGYYYSLRTLEPIAHERCFACEDDKRHALEVRQAEIDRARRLEDINKNLNRYLLDGNVPEKYITCNIDIPECAEQAVIQAISGRSVYFHGGVGVGKTTIAVHISRERILRQLIPCHGLCFRSTESICSFVRNGIDTGEHDKRLEAFFKYELLVMDDLMAERDTKNNLNIIKTIIYERYTNRKQTIITSNYTPDEALKYYGKRVGSRFSTMISCRVSGADRRKNEEIW